MQTMKYLSSDTGSGKTYKLIEIVNDSTELFLIVQNTKNLIIQTASKIPDSHYILSGVNSNAVLEDVMNFLVKPTKRVLLITDVTFMAIEDMGILKPWNIYVDDVVNFTDYWTANNVAVETKKMLMGTILTDFEDVGEADNVKYCTSKRRDDIEDDIARIVAKEMSILTSNDCFIMNSNFFEMDTIDVGGVSVSQPNARHNQLTVFAWKDLTKYLGLNITFMAAGFEDTMIYKSHSHVFEKIDFDGLRVRTVPVEQRLKVYYFSKKYSMTKTLRYEQPELIKKVLKYIECNVQEEFYYTANSDLLSKLNFTMGTKVKVDLRGMNNLQNFKCCVWLASMKPKSVEMKQCELFFNITREEMIIAREYQALYQWVTRGVSRDYESEEVQTVFVFDEEQARSLTDNVEYIDIGIDDIKKKREPMHLSRNVAQLYKRIGQATKIKNLEDFMNWLNSEKNSNLTERERKLFIEKYIKVTTEQGKSK